MLFVDLNYKYLSQLYNKWNLILGYIVNSLLIPIVIIIIMIIGQCGEITDKYKVKSKK